STSPRGRGEDTPVRREDTVRAPRRSRAAEPRASPGGRSPGPVVGVAGERRGGGLDLAALVEDLDAPLRLFELRVAEARQLHTALEQGERLLEREVSLFERLHDRLELCDGGL